MRACITVAGVVLEGSIDALPQLLHAMKDAGVPTLHPHHFLIAPLDGEESVRGTCWCGATREFSTVLATSQMAVAAAVAKTTGGKRPKSATCGRNHLPTKACAS